MNSQERQLWFWNEFAQAGTDYTDLNEIEQYESRMSQFRDIAGENRLALDKLSVQPGHKVLEIGCGTGLFARAAAKAGAHVTALDVSEPMLRYARHASEKEGLSVECVHEGFLGMDFPDESFDAVMSSLALHHLPDFWKEMALQKISSALKRGGRFYLFDVIFAPGDSKIEVYVEKTLAVEMPASSGSNFQRHVRQEFSTLDWIMRGLLEQNGLHILEEIQGANSFLRGYLCEKA